MKNKVKYLTVVGVILVAAGVLSSSRLPPAPRSCTAGLRRSWVWVKVTLNQAAVPVDSLSLSSLQTGLRDVAKNVLPTVVEINVTQTLT